MKGFEIHSEFLFFSVPAVRAKPAFVNVDGIQHIVQTVKAQRSKILLLSDFLHHLSIL